MAVTLASKSAEPKEWARNHNPYMCFDQGLLVTSPLVKTPLNA